jgi:hypothetical protein
VPNKRRESQEKSQVTQKLKKLIVVAAAIKSKLQMVSLTVFLFLMNYIIKRLAVVSAGDEPEKYCSRASATTAKTTTHDMSA